MNDRDPESKADVLDAIDRGWTALTTFLEPLTEEQMTVPTDAAGWTVKDHLVHIVIWLQTVPALVEGRSLAAALEVSEETYREGYEAVNAELHRRFQHVSLDEVLQRLHDTHDSARARLEQMDDQDFFKPFNHYQPTSARTDPVVRWIMGDTADHYVEHVPWMRAIVDSYPG